MVNLKIEFKFLLILCALFSLATSDRIIPDPNFPVLLKYASSNASGTVLELRFKLPMKTNPSASSTATSYGITYGQFIGVRFSADSTLSFASTAPGCKLTSATQTFDMEFKVPETSAITSTQQVDNTILFCKLVDRTDIHVPAMETLTLTLTFAAKLPTFFIQNIGIFTSTTNTPNRLMIDSIPVLGSVGVYNDFTSQNLNHVVSIKNGNVSQLSTITSPSNPPSTTVIYPNYTVDVKVELNFNQYWIIDPADYTFYFKWDLNSYGYPTTVKTEAVSTAADEVITKATTLTIIEMTDGIIVTGFVNGELYPNRKFKVVFNGMKTTDKNLGTTTNIALYVFYRNTYSVVSYSSIGMDVVNKIPLTDTSVAHPEAFPIYDGMGWPFLFTFSSPVEIVGGAFVVIRQRDYNIKTSSAVLIAATCDFSLNSGVDQSFTQRKHCQTLRNDFAYDTLTGTTLTEGQGIFFKINNTLVAKEKFYLRVWGFVDVCVGATQAENYAASLSFTIRLFKTASPNDSVLNEKRFFGTSSGNYPIAEALTVTMEKNCYHLQTRTDLTNLTTDLAEIPPIITNQNWPIGIEINNIMLAKEPTTLSTLNTLTTPATAFFTYPDGVETFPSSSTFPVQYLYSTGSTLANSAFLMFGISRASTVVADTTGFRLMTYIPSECRSTTDDQLLDTITTARIQWLFSKQWLTSKKTIDAGCQVSWEWYRGAQNTYSALYFGQGVSTPAAAADKYKTTISSSTSLTTQGTTTRSKNMDTTLSSTTSTSTTFKITSNSYTLNTTFDLASMAFIGSNCATVSKADITYTNEAAITNAAVVGVYSDCLQFNSSATVTWMYTYFEVQALLLNGTRPTRIWRFIKLYPELGVFHSPASMEAVSDASAKYTNASQKWITAHYQATTSSYAPFAVCLIEIDPIFINVFKDTTSNTLVIWLFATSLLETDVVNGSNEYPIAPSTNNKAYGLNSGQTMSMAFRRLGDTVPTTNALPDPNNRSDLGELEMYIYNTVFHYSYLNGAASPSQSVRSPTGFEMSRTLYHLYLGSAIYIPASSTFVTDNNIYIPFLCPSFSGYTSATAYPANGIYWVEPTVSVAWVSMSAYNSISGVQRYIRPNNISDAKNNTIEVFDATQKFTVKPNSAIIKSPIMFPLFRSKKTFGATLQASNPRTDAATTRVAMLGKLKLQFNPYNKTTDNLDKKLIISNTNGANTYLSSISTFLNSSVGALSSTVETNVAITNGNNSTNMKVSTIDTPVYIMGKPFNRFLAYAYSPYSSNDLRSNIDFDTATGTDVTDNLFSFSTASSITVTGIPRISVDTLNSSTYIHLTDYIAVFMTRNTIYATDKQIFTNLYYPEDADTAVFKNFLIFHPETDNTNWNGVLSVDSTGASIKSDKGGNILVTGTFPSTVPSASQLILDLTSGVIQSTTVCGLKEGSNALATICTPSGTTVTCNLTQSASTFRVCCYNIFNNSAAMQVSSGQAVMPFNSAFITTSVISSYPNIWYKYPAVTTTYMAYFDFSTRASTDLTTSTSFFGKLTNIDYSISSTNGGFGKALLTVTLPREAVRGMILKVVANLSSMKIPNIQPRIVPSFGSTQLFLSDPDSGDALLDDVYSNFDSTGIELRLRNVIYKCGISLATQIYIQVWPVYTPNYAKLTASVEMKGPDSSDLALSTSHEVTSKPAFTETLLSYNTDMCKLADINPRIVGEYAEYTFEVSLAQVASSLETLSTNEVLLYFPHQYYEEMPDVVCYNAKSTNPLECSFIEKSILSIRSSSALSIETTNSFTIVGLKNPYLATNSGVYFGCSVNDTNFYTNTRITKFVGTFTYNSGIFDSLTDTTFGNIIFLNSQCYQTFTTISAAPSTQGAETASVQALEPREDPPRINASRVTLHQFAFTLDIANDMIKTFATGYTFTNSPVLYVTFPPEYKFHWYSFTPTATIESYFSIQTDLKNVEKDQLIEVDKITVVGNQLRITFLDADTKTALTSIKFDKYFQHFLLKIYGLPTPVESTSFVEGRKTTERINFTFFNNPSTGRTVYKNWTNMHNFAGEDFATNLKINELIPDHKGFMFEFSNARWVIDVVDKSSSVNMVTIYSGRYATYYFKRRNTNLLVEPAHVDISLVHSTLKFNKPVYNFASGINSYVAFQVGVACNTNPGYIVAAMNLSAPTGVTRNIYDLFLPLSPVVYTISNSLKGLISFKTSYVVRINGSIFVDFTTDTPLVDPVELKFTPTPESSIDDCKIEVGKLSCRTVMRVAENVRNTQSFLLGTPSNNCYKYPDNVDRISFEINGVAAIIPNDALKPGNFQYLNSENDSTIAVNSVKFRFSSEYTQIYLYAVLVCLNEEFPTDQAMTNNTSVNNSTDKIKYFTEILNVSGTTDIVFENLLRGSAYKLKVIITSTDGLVANRTRSTIELFNYTLTNGTIVSFIVPKSTSTRCLSYRFKTRPGIQVTSRLLWYWQNQFNGNGYYESGCITPVDQYGNQVPGLPSIRNETNCGRQNCRFIDYQDYIVNQTSLGVSETYTICAYPLATCGVNPVSYTETINSIQTTLATNATFKTVLNIEVTPEFVLSDVTDGFPSTPTVSQITRASNKVTFKAVSSGAIQCFIRPATGSAAPALSAFETCSGDCSAVSVSSTEGTYTITVSSTAELNLYAVCYNELFCSSSSTNVLNLGRVTGTSGGNGTNNNSTSNGTDGNGTANATSWISMNFMILMVILSLLI